jgi:hypothetical protein
MSKSSGVNTKTKQHARASAKAGAAAKKTVKRVTRNNKREKRTGFGVLKLSDTARKQVRALVRAAAREKRQSGKK